ncbi:hypothetical protein QCF01_18120, partial [Staphylococcus aureus]|nr:hypothetical protein [Staphylococcus aureus]
RGAGCGQWPGRRRHRLAHRPPRVRDAAAHPGRRCRADRKSRLYQCRPGAERNPRFRPSR